jgi:hypothetical protein
MKVLSLVWGILAFFGMFVAFLPLLGALNWLNIPFALVGLFIGIIVVATGAKDKPKGMAIAGLVLCAVAVLVGILRLSIGFGVV